MTNALPKNSVFKNVRAVIFDLDGTLIDSLDIWNAVDVRLLAELGYPPMTRGALCAFREKALVAHAREENPYVGFCTDLGKLCKSTLTGTDIHQMRYRISRRLLKEDMRWRPGAADVVMRIRALGLQTAIATTTKRANIDLYDTQNPVMMQEMRLRENFPIILTRENVRFIKPDPEIYLKALEAMKLSPSDCLVFEDSIAGVTAAKAAGIPVCSIREPWSEEDLPAIRKTVIKHFQSWEEVLLELVERKIV